MKIHRICGLHWVIWTDQREIRLPLRYVLLAMRVHRAAIKAQEREQVLAAPPTLSLGWRQP